MDAIMHGRSPLGYKEVSRACIKACGIALFEGTAARIPRIVR
jgi:hypothetical protein